ncbi:MAG: hypothetical protein LBD47_01120, partial [Treponema sp.]|nr:hypothetical protein [Treponema sp.]
MKAVQTVPEWKAAADEIWAMMKETDRQIKETDKRLDKQLGKLGSRFGEMVEYMIVPNLLAKFRDL